MSMVCRSHARLIGRTPIRHAFRTAVMRILVTRARQARMVSVDCVEVADVVDGVFPASAAMASCVLDATQIATMATTSDFLRIRPPTRGHSHAPQAAAAPGRTRRTRYIGAFTAVVSNDTTAVLRALVP